MTLDEFQEDCAIKAIGQYNERDFAQVEDDGHTFYCFAMGLLAGAAGKNPGLFKPGRSVPVRLLELQGQALSVQTEMDLHEFDKTLTAYFG